MQGSTSTFVTGIVIVGCTFAESPPNSDATYSRHCSFSIRHPRRVHEQHRSVTCEQVPVERLWVQISCFPDTLPHGASPRPVRPVTSPPHLPAALSLALRPCSLALARMQHYVLRACHQWYVVDSPHSLLTSQATLDALTRPSSCSPFRHGQSTASQISTAIL
jgi:hypothetical protein